MANYSTGWVSYGNMWAFQVVVSEKSQDVTNNKTTISCQLQLKYIYSQSNTMNVDGTYYMTINGTQYSYTYTPAPCYCENGTILPIFSKQVTITHNSDGTKTIPIVMQASMTGQGNFSAVTRNVTLTPIPRASSFSLNVSSATIGSTQITVNISRASSSFTHKVYYSCSSSHSWQANSGNESATSVSWVPSINDCNHYPNSTSGTATIRVDTYSGSTKIGTASKTLTMNVPSSVVPSISSVSVTENGGSGISNTFVKGKSKANVSISASGSYSSTISSYSTTITGLSTKSGSSFTSDTLNTHGTITFTTTVKDSRGRSASKSTTITVYDYFTPSFTIKAERCTSDGTIDEVNGTYFKITTAVTSYADLGSANVLTWEVYSNTNSPGAEGWYLEESGTGLKSSGYVIAGGDRATPDNSHEAKIVIKDKYGTYERKVDIPTAYVTMDFLQGGKGIAFGKVASLNDTFECNMHGQFNRPLKATRGTYCYQAGGTGGQNGYIKFCTIRIIGDYANSPLRITVGRRRDLTPKEISISWKSIGGSNDPDLESFRVKGIEASKHFALHKSSASTWDLYAFKNETWDNVGVFDVQMSKYLADKIEIQWVQEQANELPSGYVLSTPYNSGLLPHSGNWFNNGTPIIGEDGGMEIGKYIDFHHTKEYAADYSTRLAADEGNLSISGHFLPAKNSNFNLGNTSYRWNWLNLVNQPNVSSDRTLKENITYVKSEKVKSAPTDEVVTYEDMYDFVKNDLELATYNFIGQEEQCMNFIAQDLLYNIDGSDSKIGQMIINPVAPPTEEEIEEVKAKLEEGEEYNYPTLSYDMGMYISVLAGALKTALNKIDTQQVLIDNLTEEIKNLKESE